MQDVRQVFSGIGTALVSIALLFGGFSISLAEGNTRLPAPILATPSQLIPTLTIPPLPTPNLPQIITLTSQPSPSLEGSPTSLPPTWTPTLTPPSSNCPLPPGWLPYIVQPGDTLDGLALRFKKTSLEISLANCLVTVGLLPGQLIYLPPSPTHTPAQCSAPQTWIIYVVQQGDTLYHLGQVYGISYLEIMRANCLTSSNIHIGQQLYVPPWATRTPSPTSILYFDTPTGMAIGETSTPTDTAIPNPDETVPPQ